MVLLHHKLIANSAAYRLRHKNVTPHRDSDKHWPFLVEVARTLYGNAEFAISSARRFSAPVSKFEESPGKYNVEQIKILLKCKGLKQSGKLENF